MPGELGFLDCVGAPIWLIWSSLVVSALKLAFLRMAALRQFLRAVAHGGCRDALAGLSCGNPARWLCRIARKRDDG
jgi:hypothetical protein